MRPDWLPNELRLNGTIDEDYAQLYEVFTCDLKSGGLEIEGFPVVLNNSPDPILPQYELGFTHLVTRGDVNGFRTIDYERACKLSWIRPVVDNYTEPEVYTFWTHSPKESTLYLWLFDLDFVVILKKMRSAKYNERIIVTAFSVDPNRRRDLQRRYGSSNAQIL